MSKKISQLGERGFIEKILGPLSRLKGSPFLLPPGDDAAILPMSGSLVLSIDGLVEGTHFRLSWQKKLQKQFRLSMGHALGWKLMGSALSDLAATGPTKNRWALLFLGAPAALPAQFLLDIFNGAKEAAKTFQCAIAGGDTVRSEKLVLAAAVGGALQGRRFFSRSGAKVGDRLAVVGTVGDAGEGLRFLEGKRKHFSGNSGRYFVNNFFYHEPRFKEMELLAKDPGVTAVMDLSDPLPECVDLLLKASKKGGEVDIGLTPVSAPFNKYSTPQRAWTSSGEDYSLLIAASASAIRRLQKNLTLKVIGSVKPPSKGLEIMSGGRLLPLQKTFRHFK